MSRYLNYGLILLLFAVGCDSRNAGDYLQEGIAFYQAGDVEMARLQIQNALQLEPGHAEAYYYLALIAESKKDWGAMFRNLQNTITLDSQFIPAKLKLAQLWLSGGHLDQAETYANEILTINEDHLPAKLLWIAVRIRKKNYPPALEQLEVILKNKPYHPEAIALKIAYLNQISEETRALGLLNDAIRHQPESYELRQLKIRMDVEAARIDDAIAGFKQLQKLLPDQIHVYQAQLDFLLSIGKEQQAREVLKALIRLQPEDIELKLKLIKLTAMTQSAEVEESVLREMLADQPDQSLLKFALAEVLIKQNKYAQAKHIYLQMLDKEESSQQVLTAKSHMAYLAQLQKDTATMQLLIEDILHVDQHHKEALLLRAGLHLKNNKIDAAISDLRIVLMQQSDAEQALLLMAEANKLKGENQVAEAFWRKVLTVNPLNDDALNELIPRLLTRKEYSQVDRLIRAALFIQPDHAQFVELLIKLKIAQQDWQSALQATQRLQAVTEHGQIAATYWQGIIASTQNNTTLARAKFNNVLQQQAGHQPSLDAMAHIYAQLEQHENWAKYLSQLTAARPQATAAWLALAKAHREANQWVEHARIVKTLIKHNPHALTHKLLLLTELEKHQGPAIFSIERLLQSWIDKKPEQIHLKLRLAQYYERNKRFAEAESILVELATSTTLNYSDKELVTTAKFWIAMLSEQKGNDEQAIHWYKKLLSESPEHKEALDQLAQLYHQKGLDHQFVNYIKSLMHERSQSDALHHALARSLIKTASWQQAATVLRDKIHMSPRDRDAYMLLAHVEQQQGRATQAEQVLLKGVTEVAADLLLMKTLARFYLTEHQYDLAIEQYQRMLKIFPENDALANDLADLLATHQDDNALSMAQALQLIQRFKQNHQPQVLDTIGWVHLKAGNIKQAVKSLQQAVAKLPDDPRIRYHLAEALSQSGDRFAAKKQISTALNLVTNPGDFYELPQARLLHQQLLQPGAE